MLPLRSNDYHNDVTTSAMIIPECKDPEMQTSGSAEYSVQGYWFPGCYQHCIEELQML